MRETDVGIVIDVNELQLRNAYSPRVVTNVGMLNDSNDLPLSKTARRPKKLNIGKNIFNILNILKNLDVFIINHSHCFWKFK